MARILLVDDEAATLDFVRRGLEAAGHEVTIAPDGDDALAAISGAAVPFELLITDVQMPGMDGVALAQAVLTTHPAISLLLMSGFDLDAARLQSVSAFGARLISKPFTIDQIRAEADKILAAR